MFVRVFIYIYIYVYIYIYIYMCVCVCVCVCVFVGICVYWWCLYPEPVHCTVTNCPPWSFWSSSDLGTWECDYNHCTVHCCLDKVGVIASTVAVGRQWGTSKKVSPRIFSRGFENVRTFANFSRKLSKWVFREQKLAVCGRNLWKRWMYWHKRHESLLFHCSVSQIL